MNSVFIILVALFEGAILLLLPHYSPRRYFFAITVAPDFRTSPAARDAVRRYHWWVAAGVISAIALSGFLVPPVLPFLCGFAGFLRERSVVRRYAAPVEPIREATLSTEDDHLPAWTALALLPLAAPLAAAAWLRAHWDEIPARFPTHWNAGGQPDGWADKSPQSVYGPLLYCAGMTLFILLISIGTYYGSRRGPQRIPMLKLLVMVTYVMAVVFSGMALTPVLPLSPWIFVAPIPAFVVVVIVWSYRMVRRQTGEATPDDRWVWGSIYYNPQDAAVFVQKRVGFGYTFNFGNRMTWVILGGFAGMFGGLVLLLPK